MTDDPKRPPSVLQTLQRQFDADRGFEFRDAEVPSVGDSPAELSLKRIEFSTLALAGEVGELANLVKKVRRARWMGWPEDVHLAGAANELGDILAYLLKLANVLDVDLEEKYLETMAINCLRFPARHRGGVWGRIVTIAGPTGAGKSTIVSKLAARRPAYVEHPGDNPYLPDVLRDDAKADAYSNQMWFLRSVAEWVRNADPSQDLVIDQDPLAITAVYARYFRERGSIQREEFLLLYRALLELESDLTRWDSRRLVIFLDATPQVLCQRVVTRDRGLAPSLSWFDELRRRFVSLAALTPSKTIRTDTLSADEVVDEVERLIRTCRSADSPA